MAVDYDGAVFTKEKPPAILRGLWSEPPANLGPLACVDSFQLGKGEVDELFFHGSFKSS